MRILTTHVGSLIRPPALLDYIRSRQTRAPYDRAAYERCLADSVKEVVRRQVEIGVDIPSDGEFGKAISWSQYALERLSGFERRPVPAGSNPFSRGADRTRFAEFYAELDRADGPPATARATGSPPVCPAPLRSTRPGAAARQSSTPGRRRCSATSPTSRRRLPPRARGRGSCRSQRRRA